MFSTTNDNKVGIMKTHDFQSYVCPIASAKNLKDIAILIKKINPQKTQQNVGMNHGLLCKTGAQKNTPYKLGLRGIHL